MSKPRSFMDSVFGSDDDAISVLSQILCSCIELSFLSSTQYLLASLRQCVCLFACPSIPLSSLSFFISHVSSWFRLPSFPCCLFCSVVSNSCNSDCLFVAYVLLDVVTSLFPHCVGSFFPLLCLHFAIAFALCVFLPDVISFTIHSIRSVLLSQCCCLSIFG